MVNTQKFICVVLKQQEVTKILFVTNEINLKYNVKYTVMSRYRPDPGLRLQSESVINVTLKYKPTFTTSVPKTEMRSFQRNN